MAAERQIHSAIIKALRLMLPPAAWIGTIPGGDGSRTMAPGYVKGTPDILIVYQGRAHFIEVKGPRGRLSPEQNAVAAALVKAGAAGCVAQSLDEAIDHCLSWCIPLRGDVTRAA